jgi:DNA-binding transcriptional LysR family regulator
MDDENSEVVSLPQAPDAIELRHLRAFVAVADELNFGRAAARLYLSQPALSRQIRSLERLVGCGLLRRSTHRVELTLAGEALLDRARGLLREVDEAVSAARSVGGELLARIARHWESFAEVSPADLQELRVAFEGLHAQFEPPPGISVRSVNSGGVPGLLVAPARAVPRRHPRLPPLLELPARGRPGRGASRPLRPRRHPRRPGRLTPPSHARALAPGVACWPGSAAGLSADCCRSDPPGSGPGSGPGQLRHPGAAPHSAHQSR